MELQSPKPDEHLETLAQMFAATFSTYWDRRRYVHDGYIAGSDYDWNASRVGVEDGEVATHFGVWDRRMRIGSAAVRVAAIGAVATLEHHRKRGLMAKTAANCVDRLSEAGYDLSLLFGIPGFYHKFGYVRSFPNSMFYLDVRDNPGAEKAPELTEGGEDIAAFSEQYNRENEGVTGTWVRPTYGTNRKPGTYKLYRFSAGYIYVQRSEDELQVVDCAGPPDQVVAAGRELARGELCPTLVFPFLPPRSAVGEYIRTLRHRYDLRHEAGGGPMFKTVNLAATTRKMLPVWTERLRAAGWGDYSGTLGLISDAEAVVLTITEGIAAACQAEEPESVRKSGEWSGVVDAGASLVRFYVGDEPVHRVVRQSGATLSGHAAHLAPVLFPHEEPSTVLWDRF